MELTKVNDLYNSWETGDGVFTDLNSYDVPWKVEDVTENANIIKALNYGYHGNHSGDKNVSPIVYKFIKDEVTTPRAKLADTLFIMFGDKWLRLWDALHAEYNPIENYDLTETETPAETTHTITPAETTTTITPAEITNTTKPAKLTTENGVSAFNSSGYADDTKTTVEGDDNNKGTDALTVNTAGSNSIDVDTAGSDVFTVQNDRELRRHGNIGIMSATDLLKKEIDVRQWNYFKGVFNDIDTLLTLSIY